MASGAPLHKILYFLVPFYSTCYTKVDILFNSDLNGKILLIWIFSIDFLASFVFDV